MNDKYQKNIEKPLINFYKKANKNVNMEKIFNEINTLSKQKNILYPLVKYIIKNNTLFVDEEVRKHYINKKDARLEENFNLINKTISYCIKNKLNIPNTTLYIWISDRFPWYGDKYNNIPIFLYAKPKNIDYPIFPDNTFECLTFDKKYSSNCFDWDKTKKLFIQYNEKIKNKKNVIYFKGTDTTRNNHKLRGKLENYSKKNKNFIILLDAWTKYEPIYNFSNYQFLLNLPGHYPWSNRLKYLFLTQSIVININVKTISYGKDNYIDEEYQSFIDQVITKKDYIDILLVYYKYKGDDPILIEKNNEKNEKEFNKVINKINFVFNDYKNNKNKYDKIIQNTYNKVINLTNERIYSYIYKGILENSKIIKK
jgi:hypothetical protein